MRKDPHSKEGGTGRIKVIYLVIWPQECLCHKKREKKANPKKDRFKRLETDRKRGWHQNSSWGEFFCFCVIVVFKENYGQINSI